MTEFIGGLVLESQMCIVVQISFIFIRTKMYVQVKGAVAFGFALALAGAAFLHFRKRRGPQR